LEKNQGWKNFGDFNEIKVLLETASLQGKTILIAEFLIVEFNHEM
jgi:hypothetical protein